MSRGMSRRHGPAPAKALLPQKTCATCGRPFTWRKAWARDWDRVRHCSQRCRRTRKPSAAAGPDARPD